MDFKFADLHYDCMPRDIAEKALWQCSPPQFKILYIIARQTLGFQKFKDRIPLSQFQQKAKLSRNAVISALTQLEADGWIVSSYICAFCNRDHPGKPRGCPHCGCREQPDKEYALCMSLEMVDFYIELWRGGASGEPPR